MYLLQFFVNFVLLPFLWLACESRKFTVPYEDQEKESKFWLDKGRQEIEDALVKPQIVKKAKNVILFIGDGMGNVVNTAGRIYKGQTSDSSGEETILSWEKFPNVALLKTYSVDKQVTDSAASATAFLSGVKTNLMTLGVTGRVKFDDCKASKKKDNWVQSIIEAGQLQGKDTGIITTSRITHATPGAAYAHSPNRGWECDSKIPPGSKSCKDIARQLVEELPGKNINVIFGGGRRQFGAPLPGDDVGVTTDTSCLRDDGRNLVSDWKKDKEDRGLSHAYVTNKSEFKKIRFEELDFVMGLFDGDHLPYELDRKSNASLDSPSLAELTEAAIRRLSTKDEGFILLVEGARIDHALHENKMRLTLEDFLAMEEAVEQATKMVDLQETLIIVTADHSHALTIAGYPGRGNDILGKIDISEAPENLPYPTLMFSVAFGLQYELKGNKIMRKNITHNDTAARDFVSPGFVDAYGVHGGEDVALWAAGPMSHLFHKVHDQSYVAHVIKYATCSGIYKTNCLSITERREGRVHHR